MKVSGMRSLLMVLLAGSLLLSSCKEENLKPGVPAFVHVDSFTFSANYGLQGTSHQKIADVWVFADGETIGVFELPVSIPILKEGAGELRLEAGIELNGISTTRVNNPFFEPIIIENFQFLPDSITPIMPSTTYRESTVFVWMEDFEDPSVSIDTTHLDSSTDMERIGGAEAYEGSYSGLISLDGDHKTFEGATFDGFVLPVNGQPVLLEMNYKNDYYFSVGVIAQNSTQVIKSEIIVLNPSTEWKKIYINFTDKVREQYTASSFKVLIRTYITDDDAEATIMLDNLKLMYR